jgi:hypothetical protein
MRNETEVKNNISLLGAFGSVDSVNAAIYLLYNSRTGPEGGLS